MANTASMLQGQQAVKSVKHPLLHPSPFSPHSYLLLPLACSATPPTHAHMHARTHAHASSLPAPVNNKLSAHKYEPSGCGETGDQLQLRPVPQCGRSVKLLRVIPENNLHKKKRKTKAFYCVYHSPQACPFRLCGCAEHKDSIRQLHVVAL